MSARLSSPERLDADTDVSPEETREVRRIDELIGQCNDRVANVSPGILSSATIEATFEMYRDLREQAVSDESLRAKHVGYMEENVKRLQENIEKAARERETFDSDLRTAVENGWIHQRDVGAWMATFDNPNLLEMYRSQWLEKEWPAYKKQWKDLDEARVRTLAKAEAAGLTTTDLPDLAILKERALFLARDRKFPARRTLVDTVEALIDATAKGKQAFVKKMESKLSPASKGKNRYLHPAKVGEWLKKIASDPQHYSQNVIETYMNEWKHVREQYDALAQRYEKHEKPDGCAPMTVNAFLALPYDARLVALTEWGNRLDAAERLQQDASDALEREKRSIRNSIDLHDIETAEERLFLLQKEHPDDRDILSIGRHIEMLRTQEEDHAKSDDGPERTEEALRDLHAVPHGVPSVIAAHYAYILESGDVEHATTFFQAMKLRGDRSAAGSTTAEDEREANEAAEIVEEATVLEATDPDDAAEMLVTEETPPATTMRLLKEHVNGHMGRAPALVIEGLSLAQQQQLVHVNRNVLQDLRHLQRVGKTYEKQPVVRAA